MNTQNAITSKFNQMWEPIEREFQLVKDAKLLPFEFTDVDGVVGTISEETVQKQLDNLKNEKFTISVCGMVKAGKSTFLNALLFGEDILPTFDTPMTAKLNFIEYTTEKNHFVATFYSQQEWRELLDSLDEENIFQLNERIQMCAENYGIDADNCIGAPPVMEQDLKKLEEYVSDPKSKNGKFTPFVKDVHIFINNENIKEVMIVDTPGLNDPNVINSRETVKWIKNTHALIFLLPPKSIDESSLNFFDTHLLGTRPTNRIWVINKIDDISPQDLQKSIAYLRALGTQEEFKCKNLFGREEKICGYSALIAMLRNMEAKGISLNDDQIFHLDAVDEDFEPDPDQLPSAISERLYQNTGIKRVISGFSVINNLYLQQIKKTDFLISQATMQIADGEKSKEELQAELDDLTDKTQAFKKNLQELKVDLNDTVFNRINNEIVKKIGKSIETLERKMKLDIESSTSAETLRNLPYVFQSECEKIFGQYGEMECGVRACVQTLREELRIVCQRIKNAFAQNQLKGNVDFSPIEDIANVNFSAEDISGDLANAIQSRLPSNWFTEICTSNKKMRERIKGPITETCTRLRQDFNNNVNQMQLSVAKQINGNFQTFLQHITDTCMQKTKTLQANSTERQELVAKAQQQKQAATDLMQKVKEMQSSFRNKMPQEIWTNAN